MKIKMEKNLKPCKTKNNLSKLSIKNEEQIKTSPDKQKLMKFIITRPILQETLKGFFNMNEMDTSNLETC
jgi:hypothetical protein